MNATSAPKSLPLYRTGIEPAWIDYNGHLRDAYYGLIVSYAIDDFMDHVGVDTAYRTRTRCTLYTLEMHIHYLHEVKSTDQLDVETLVLDVDAKRIHAGCRFNCPRVSGALATADLLLMHVQQADVPAGTTFPDDIAQRLQALKIPAEASAAWGPRSQRIEIKRRPGSRSPT